MTTQMTGRYQVPEIDDRLAFIEVDPSTSPHTALGQVLCFDPGTGSLWLSVRHSIDGTLESTWHGRLIEWGIPTTLNAIDFSQRINAGEIDALLDRIRDGYDERWDGSNSIGSYTDDAYQAIEAVEEWMDRELETLNTNDGWAGLADASAYFASLGASYWADEYGLSASSTDERMGEIAQIEEAVAREEFDAVLDGAEEYLRDLRDRLRWN